MNENYNKTYHCDSYVGNDQNIIDLSGYIRSVVMSDVLVSSELPHSPPLPAILIFPVWGQRGVRLASQGQTLQYLIFHGPFSGQVCGDWEILINQAAGGGYLISPKVPDYGNSSRRLKLSEKLLMSALVKDNK